VPEIKIDWIEFESRLSVVEILHATETACYCYYGITFHKC